MPWAAVLVLGAVVGLGYWMSKGPVDETKSTGSTEVAEESKPDTAKAEKPTEQSPTEVVERSEPEPEAPVQTIASTEPEAKPEVQEPIEEEKPIRVVKVDETEPEKTVQTTIEPKTEKKPATQEPLEEEKLVEVIQQSEPEAVTVGTLGVQQALFEYRLDIGHYPTEEEGGLSALIEKPEFENEKLGDLWYGPYVKPGTTFEDPWSNALVYEPADPEFMQAGDPPFRLYSKGRDGRKHNSDDIHLKWPPSPYYDSLVKQEGAEKYWTAIIIKKNLIALENYKMTIGHYPTYEEGGLLALVQRPEFENEKLSGKKDSDSDGQGGEKKVNDLMKLLFSMLSLRESEIQHRQQTALLEQQKSEADIYIKGVERVVQMHADSMLELNRMQFDTTEPAMLDPLQETFDSMAITDNLLDKPQTDSVTFDAQTGTIRYMSDVINLINEEVRRDSHRQGRTTFVDAWANALVYEPTDPEFKQASDPHFCLYSKGPDGIEETYDDLGYLVYNPDVGYISLNDPKSGERRREAIGLSIDSIIGVSASSLTERNGIYLSQHEDVGFEAYTGNVYDLNNNIRNRSQEYLGSVKKGKKEGFWVYFQSKPSGSSIIKEFGNLSSGKKEGYWISFYDNGRKEAVRNYNNGEVSFELKFERGRRFDELNFASESTELLDPLTEPGIYSLEQNRQKPGVVTTASGLQYKIIKEGDGPYPDATDSVTVNYKGTLIDGTEFDSGKAISFPLNGVIKGWTESERLQLMKTGGSTRFFIPPDLAYGTTGSGVIKGWTEGLQLMKTGGSTRFFIPPDLAYGTTGSGAKIGPNATLIFDFDLLSIKGKEAAKAPASATIDPAKAAPKKIIKSDIIRVPTAEEMKRGAKIEVIKKEDLQAEIKKAQEQSEKKADDKK